MEKSRKLLIETLLRLNRQAAAEQNSQLQQVLQLQRLLNRDLTTKKVAVKESSQKKQPSVEEVVAKKELALTKQIETAISEAQTKLKQVSEAVSDEPKPKNYHYRPSNPPPPPRPPTKKDNVQTTVLPSVRKPTIAELNRQRSQQRTKELLMEKEQAKTKKETVTGKVTELPAPNRGSRSVDKAKIAAPIPAEKEGNTRVVPPRQPEEVVKRSCLKQESKSEEKPVVISTRQQSKSLPTSLESFSIPIESLSFLKQQKNVNRQKVKSFIQSYHKEELGYRADENKERLLYLKHLNRYVSFKKYSDRHYTDAIERRGWKGCDYVDTLKAALMNLNPEQLHQVLTDKRVKAVTLREVAFKAQRIRESVQSLLKEKSSIRAPRAIELRLEFVPQQQKSKPILGRQPKPEESLMPLYSQLQPMLESMLQLRSLSKLDVKLLVEIQSLVANGSRKVSTVIEKSQLKQFLLAISDEN